MALNSRTALVTGANRGMGLAVARGLLDAGHRVALGCRDPGRGLAALESLEAEDRAIMVLLDTAEPETLAGAVFECEDALGPVEILVNNAAIYPDEGELCHELPAEVFPRTIATNLLGPYELCRLVLPGMKTRGSGRIVNVSSGYGAMAAQRAGTGSYKVSKLALNGLTRVLADELSEMADIKINAVCPGWVRTEMGGPSASRSIAEGAAGILHAALLPSDGPTGAFLRDGEPIAW